jgi:GntR family transcriptional repressor for pyruvate dehydrogenase complex
LSFAPIRRLKIAEQIAGTIRDAIVGGRFRPGDALPGERELAEQFDVNRSTVREAIHRLEAEGLVEVRHGGGTVVRDFLLSSGFQLLPYLVAPGGAVDPVMLRDLLEMRVMLLGWTARQAASRATPEQIDSLRVVLAELEAGLSAGIQEADFRFFEILVEMTKNHVLSLLANAVKQVYLENRQLFASLYASGFDPSDHRRALEAIVARDAEAAAAAMVAFGNRPLAFFGAPTHG